MNNFFRKIFSKKENQNTPQDNTERLARNFKKNIRFNDGKKGKQLVEEICSGKLDLEGKTDQELAEIQKAFLDYLENLKVRNDKCMEELRIKQFQLNNYKKNME